MEYLDVAITNRFQSHVPKGYYDPVKGHSGEDRLLAIGTEISMPIKLKCVSIKQQPEMGLTCYLEDINGNIHVFAHNTSINVKEGQTAEKGVVFAISGNTGSKTTAPHSHWEVITKNPSLGYRNMDRTLGEFKGFNIPPTEYVKGVVAKETKPHWSDEHFAWAISKGIVTQKYPHAENVTWGELVSVLHKLFNSK